MPPHCHVRRTEVGRCEYSEYPHVHTPEYRPAHSSSRVIGRGACLCARRQEGTARLAEQVPIERGFIALIAAHPTGSHGAATRTGPDRNGTSAAGLVRPVPAVGADQTQSDRARYRAVLAMPGPCCNVPCGAVLRGMGGAPIACSRLGRRLPAVGVRAALRGRKHPRTQRVGRARRSRARPLRAVRVGVRGRCHAP